MFNAVFFLDYPTIQLLTSIYSDMLLRFGARFRIAVM